LLVSKADVEELNSQWAQKNIDLSSEIEQLKVIHLIHCCFKLLGIQATASFGPCLKLSVTAFSQV